MNMQQDYEEQESPNIFAALPSILWQRRWLLIPPLVLCTGAGIAAAYMLPAQYESSATVLIESAQLGNDVTGASQGDYIEQRIARARERVLSRQDLIRAIRANDLYPKEQQSKPLSSIVDQMRKATSIQPYGMDGAAGMQAVGGKNTIALRIGYRYEDPIKAQIIAQQFVTSFLQVDAEATAANASGAAAFLSEQAADVQGKLAAVQGQIAKIKSQYGAVLAIGPSMSGNPAADAARIDGEIAAIQAQLGVANSNQKAGLDPNVVAAQEALRVARARFADTHPDVIAAKAQLESARQAALANANLDTPQTAAARAQLTALRNARALVLSQDAASKATAAQAPAISATVDQLEKQAEGLLEQQRTINGKLQSAQMASKLDTEQKGERLTLADPPLVPDSPVSPNRPMLIAASIAAGAGIGLGLIMLIELLLRPIRGVDALRSVTGEAPLALIPDYAKRPHVIIRWLERRNRRKALRPS